MDGVQCKKCRYLLKDKEGYNWCPNKMDDPDLDLIRDCEWYAVRTNADRIHNMTDEELAKTLSGEEIYPWCTEEPCKYESCTDCVLTWLKQEAKT